MNSKVQKVMHEFGSGKLKSSSGQKVSNPKQAIAIALSESRRAKRYEGGGAVETGKKQEYVRVEGDAAKAATVATKQAIAAGARAERAAPQDIKNQLQDVANERAAAAFELRKKSGMAKGGIAQANTHHGKLDLPFKQLNRMAGMKGGGSVKKYAKGAIVSEKDYKASGYGELRDYLNAKRGLTRRGETAEQNTIIQSKARAARGEPPPPSNLGAIDMRLETANRQKAEALAAENKQTAQDNAREMRAKSQFGKLTDPGGGDNLSQADMTQFDAKGGLMKESKMKKGGMARGGMKMPMAMMSKLRTPTMAATKLGAVPAMAKGGGIESKGKTKGKVIKMAAGGSVSSASRRADGIAQRGKTKLTNY